MTEEQGTVDVLKQLRAANRRLLQAMAREKRRRSELIAAQTELREARRAVDLLIQAIQLPLPELGQLPKAEA